MGRTKTKTEADEPTSTTGSPAPTKLVHDPFDWISSQTPIKSSADIELPKTLIDQVIGQDLAVAVAQKAASQRRHLLLIGDPGTGKSMIAKAMSEMLPPSNLNDVLTYHNLKDPNNPKVLTVEAGKGPDVVTEMRTKARRKKIVNKTIEWTLIIGFIGLALFYFLSQNDFQALAFGALVVLFMVMIFKGRKDPVLFAVPKLVLSHDPAKENHAPYVDGTGAHAGALLGDVRHDPFQSGGLETPPHDRVEVGAIHRSHRGVLFIDEINVLRLESQQALLTAMQEHVYAIVGQSQTSSGAMVRTDPVPCDFILVAAGNLDAIQPPDGRHTGMHPALRSRIRGYGYEVYVNNRMDDTHENRLKLCRFVAQEVARDGRIPHFDRDAVAEVILEGQRRSGERGKLTLRLRELGGLVRTAGDIAAGEGRNLVSSEDVRKAKLLSRSLEQQIVEQALEGRRRHESHRPEGELIGVASSVGLVGSGDVGEPAGLVVPLAAVVTKAQSRSGGIFAYGGGLDESARSQTETVTALFKSLSGSSVADNDVHVQSVVPQAGVEGDAYGAAIAVSVVSALERVPVKQHCAIIGSVTISGELRAVRGVSQLIEAAVDAGYTSIIVPVSNRTDVLLNPVYKDRANITLANDIFDVLDAALTGTRREEVLKRLRAGASALARHGNGIVRIKKVQN